MAEHLGSEVPEQGIGDRRRHENMKRMSAVLAVAGVTVMALVSPVAASSDARPFKGSASGVAVYVPDTECLEFGLRTEVSAGGTASHLGRMEMTGGHCASFTPSDGQLTLVAANNDTVSLDYSGPCNGVDACWFAGEVTGGTGRFDDATGQIDMTVGLSPQPDGSVLADITWTGEIGY
jgi:hypothetical protein